MSFTSNKWALHWLENEHLPCKWVLFACREVAVEHLALYNKPFNGADWESETFFLSWNTAHVLLYHRAIMVKKHARHLRMRWCVIQQIIYLHRFIYTCYQRKSSWPLVFAGSTVHKCVSESEVMHGHRQSVVCDLWRKTDSCIVTYWRVGSQASTAYYTLSSIYAIVTSNMQAVFYTWSLI